MPFYDPPSVYFPARSITNYRVAILMKPSQYSCYLSSGYKRCPSCNEPLSDKIMDEESRFEQTSSARVYDYQWERSYPYAEATPPDDDWGYSSGGLPSQRSRLPQQWDSDDDEGVDDGPVAPRGYYPPSNAPWLPGSPATAKSAHISMWAQRGTSQSRSPRRTKHQSESSRPWARDQSERHSERAEYGRPDSDRSRSGQRRNKSSKKYDSQLDKLADMVYDRLMFSTKS